MEPESGNPIERMIRSAGGEMISRPLLDAEGEIDPLAAAELMEAIEKAPAISPTVYQNPEWTTPRWTFRKEIVASFAKCACAVSPYGVPDGLEEVCKYLHAALGTVHHPKFDEDGMAMISLIRIREWLYEILYNQGVKAFDAWNERRNGRDGAGIVSAFSRPNPDDDFIDLDALLRNVVIDIRSDRRDDDRFEEKFKREQEAPPATVE